MSSAFGYSGLIIVVSSLISVIAGTIRKRGKV